MSLGPRTAGEIEAAVLMDRAADPGLAWLIVEGDEDLRFFRPRVRCVIEVAEGKAAVLDRLAHLEAAGIPGVLAVVDDDCDGLDGRRRGSENLLPTWEHDLDTLLVASPGLARVLTAHAPARVEALGGAAAVRARLFEAALPFGLLRRLNARDGLGLSFEKELRPRTFYDPHWRLLPERDPIAEAAAWLGWTPARLRSRLDTLTAAEPERLCQGHDLLALLALGMQRGGLLHDGDAPSRTTLSAALRDAWPDWQVSRLYAALRTWEAHNPPFGVLPARP